MAKCPKCNKEITFFLGFLLLFKRMWMRIRCPHCGTAPLRPPEADKSGFIFALGYILSIFIGGSPFILFGSKINLHARNNLYYWLALIWFFLSVLIIWPYIWWKKFAKLEIRILSKEIMGQSKKRVIVPILVILIFLAIIYVLLQGVPHIIFLPALVILIILGVSYILNAPK